MSARDTISKQAKRLFSKAIDAGDFEVHHKVSVDKELMEGDGKIDYTGDEYFEIKSASLKVREKDGYEEVKVKIVVER